MKMIKPIRVILETLIATVPQLANILLLLTLVYSMFSVVAVQGFSTTKYGTRLSHTANFADFPAAMLTVIQLVTGDEWQDIMLDCQVVPPACTLLFDKSVYGWEEWGLPEYEFGDCGQSTMAPIFFITFTLVCSNIMLNLFIGMILDNFSFITDEVAQEEDDDWSGGASSEQIAALTRSFKMFDRGTTYVPISSILPLMQVMFKPLGFVDPVTFSVDNTHSAKAAYQLVRAELNLILQAEWEERRRLQNKGLLRRLLSFEAMPHYKTRFAMCVSYDDLMKVLLYWRKPEMVPYNIKVERFDRVEQCLRMNAALTISDFFRGRVAARKREKMQVYLRKRVEFSNWQSDDPHRVRRMGILAQVKAENKSILADKGGKGKGMEMRLPSTKDNVRMEKIDVMPTIMKTHRDVLEALNHDHLKPMHGVDAFIQQSEHHVVVIKFLDPRNSEQMGTAFADFTGTDWMGWVVRNTSHDTFFEPMRLQENGPKGLDWTQVDLVRRLGKTRKQKVIQYGSLIDMTSCVELRSEPKTREELEAEGLIEDSDDDEYDSDEENGKKKNVIVMESGKQAKKLRREREKLDKEAKMEKFKKTVPVSVLRINLGIMEHDEEQNDMTISEEIRRNAVISDQFLDGCAEVLGYMPSDFVMPLPGANNPFRSYSMRRASMDMKSMRNPRSPDGGSSDGEEPVNEFMKAARESVEMDKKKEEPNPRKAPSFLLGGAFPGAELPRIDSDDEDVEELLREMQEEEENDVKHIRFEMFEARSSLPPAGQ